MNRQVICKKTLNLPSELFGHRGSLVVDNSSVCRWELRRWKGEIDLQCLNPPTSAEILTRTTVQTWCSITPYLCHLLPFFQSWSRRPQFRFQFHPLALPIHYLSMRHYRHLHPSYRHICYLSPRISPGEKKRLSVSECSQLVILFERSKRKEKKRKEAHLLPHIHKIISPLGVLSYLPSFSMSRHNSHAIHKPTTSYPYPYS